MKTNNDPTPRPEKPASADGKTRKSGSKIEAAPAPPEHWKCHLSFYRHLVALTFKHRKDINKAIELLWTDELFEMPHDLAGGDTIIIPADALPYFERKGLRFRKYNVRSAGDLPPKEIAKLRREQGLF